MICSGCSLVATGLAYPHDLRRYDIGPGSLSDRALAYYADSMPAPVDYNNRDADVRRCEMARAEMARRERLDAADGAP